MKKDIHPDYRPVVFKDMNTGNMFLTGSSVECKDSVEYTDGNTYPMYEIEHSSATHPFYTGKQQLIDTAGRIERFRTRYNITVNPEEDE